MYGPCAALIFLVFIAGHGCNAASLDLFFAYAKQELVCFEKGAAEKLVTGLTAPGSGMPHISTADMVVLLELAKRPSQEDQDKDGAKVDFDIKSCEKWPDKNGGGLDEQMSDLLKTKNNATLELVQIHQYAEDDAEEPDQSLLSIWYDPNKVKPGAKAIAYKNAHKQTSFCTEVQPAKSGPVEVIRDQHFKICPEAVRGWQYGSSKSALATSWHPIDGSPPFAIIGINLPATHAKGKNTMLKRAMEDISKVLDVSRDRVFGVGDLNTRLLNSAFDTPDCGPACVQPADTKKAIELAKQGWEVLAVLTNRTEDDDDIKPCAEVTAYASQAKCEEAYSAQLQCRLDCLSTKFVDSRFKNTSAWADMSSDWSGIDPKRGAGGIDLLAKFFYFPPDKSVDTEHSSADGNWRLPTYKKLPNADVPACESAEPFLGFCSDSPCLSLLPSSGGTAVTVKADVKECYESMAESKIDIISPSDPMYSEAEDEYKVYFVKPQMGWLDSFGYSKALADSGTGRRLGLPAVVVQLFQDRPFLTMGDHGAFVASAAFDTGDPVPTSTTTTSYKKTTTSTQGPPCVVPAPTPPASPCVVNVPTPAPLGSPCEVNVPAPAPVESPCAVNVPAPAPVASPCAVNKYDAKEPLSMQKVAVPGLMPAWAPFLAIIALFSLACGVAIQVNRLRSIRLIPVTQGEVIDDDQAQLSENLRLLAE